MCKGRRGTRCSTSMPATNLMHAGKQWGRAGMAWHGCLDPLQELLALRRLLLMLLQRLHHGHRAGRQRRCCQQQVMGRGRRLGYGHERQEGANKDAGQDQAKRPAATQVRPPARPRACSCGCTAAAASACWGTARRLGFDGCGAAGRHAVGGSAWPSCVSRRVPPVAPGFNRSRSCPSCALHMTRDSL